MPENWDKLFADAETVRRRLERVEAGLNFPVRGKKPRSSRWIAAGVLLIGLLALQQISVAEFGVAPLAGFKGQVGGDISCNSLKIVGPDGKERVTLGFTPHSGFVTVHSPDSKERAILWTGGSPKYGTLNLRDEKGNNRVNLYGTKNGGLCAIYGQAGKKHVFLGSALKDEGGFLTAYGPGETPLVKLFSHEAGGQVFVNGHDGKDRAAIGVASAGTFGGIWLSGDDDKIGGELLAKAKNLSGGVLNLHCLDGSTQVILDCGAKTGGGLDLYTKKGNHLIVLGGNSKTGHGQVELLTKNGKPGVDLWVNANGEGMISGYNPAEVVVRWLK